MALANFNCIQVRVLLSVPKFVNPIFFSATTSHRTGPAVKVSICWLNQLGLVWEKSNCQGATNTE